MKKFTFLYFIVVAAGIVSCKKTLEITPYTAFTDETIYKTKDRIELAMAGVYDAAQSGFYPEGLAPRGYPFGAANIEQDDLRGEDVINMESFFQITYNSTYTSTSPNCYNMWNNCYALINKANVVIEGVTGSIAANVLTQAEGNAYIAECRFLRALATHQLLIDFAKPYADAQGSKQGVIIRDFAISSDATIEQANATGRSTVAECYKFIEDDLAYAETNLPATRSANINYRVTKAAAIALQMRVLLHEGKWANVLTAGSKIVSSSNGTTFSSPIGGWALTSTPDGPFANNISVENVFSIENTPTDNGSVSGAMQSMFGSNGAATGARGLIGISPIIWNLSYWNAADLRRNLIASNFTNNDPATAPTGKKPMYFTTKYRDAQWGDDAPQIRYAEVLLTMAEAYARSKGTVDATALSYLNAVRNRAVTATANQYTLASFATTVDFIKAVLAERRIEFLAEGKRWSDIHRLALDPQFNNAVLAGGSAATAGIPAKVQAANITAANFKTLYSGTATYTSLPKSLVAQEYDNYLFVWPLPATEITNSLNQVVKQNPIY